MGSENKLILSSDAALNEMLEPGMIVRHPAAPEWGDGQVQSRIGDRITVNFTEAGKRVIDGRPR